MGRKCSSIWGRKLLFSGRSVLFWGEKGILGRKYHVSGASIWARICPVWGKSGLLGAKRSNCLEKKCRLGVKTSYFAGKLVLRCPSLARKVIFSGRERPASGRKVVLWGESLIFSGEILGCVGETVVLSEES